MRLNRDLTLESLPLCANPSTHHEGQQTLASGTRKKQLNHLSIACILDLFKLQTRVASSYTAAVTPHPLLEIPVLPLVALGHTGC